MANKSICGMQGFQWSEQDSIMAAGQATQLANEKAALDHPLVASQAAHKARMEVMTNQIERDRMIMTGLRGLAVKPGWTNQRLAAHIFALGWASAARHCKDMRIDPDGRTTNEFKP